VLCCLPVERGISSEAESISSAAIHVRPYRPQLDPNGTPCGDPRQRIASFFVDRSSRPEMNGPQQRFSVGVVGFSDIERKVLQGIFRLSDQRRLRYAGADAASGSAPDIFLVDADNADAIAAWKAANGHGRTIAVLAGQAAVDGFAPTLSRPLQWGRLLTALDAVVAGARLAPGAAPAAEAILVADTAASARTFLKQKFQITGCNVDYADDATSALAMAEGKAYVLIFIDIAIGGGDGYQLCKQLTAGRPEAGHGRVIILTSPDLPYDRLRGAMSGCDGNLSKPIDETRLDALISRYLPHLPHLESPPPYPSET
jgi:CheY-like chemotaxis protein